MSVDQTCTTSVPQKRGQTVLRQELLLLSVSNDWGHAKCEWKLAGCFWSDVEGRCLCRHPIKERCILENMHTKKQTIGSREVETAIKLHFPGELGKLAVTQGRKALKNYA